MSWKYAAVDTPRKRTKGDVRLAGWGLDREDLLDFGHSPDAIIGSSSGGT